ncbi:MAG: 4-hydroxy-tetrahydrodipicolinate reductase [Methylobacteriaceae bacterium]|nr:4-hydroxy-tetrahydrodipicolinate reductase [Methylobacteriaceae bacterium]
MTELRVAVVGAGGRMGRMLVRAVAEERGCSLVGAVDRPESGTVGQDAGLLAGTPELGLAVTADPEVAFARAEAILDFTAPAATVAYARLTAERGLIHVVGTTGLGPGELAALREASARARVVQSGNMSLGVNLLAALVRKAAAALGPEWDIEIVEMHHRHKVDAPSGTALLLGEAAAAGREVALHERSVRGRDGHTGARRAGDIGFASLRGGTVIGEHAVVFAGAGERIELGHRAEDRALFARGAVAAALWARDRSPGLYGMADVLGLADV